MPNGAQPVSLIDNVTLPSLPHSVHGEIQLGCHRCSVWVTLGARVSTL